jgi:predicted AlkP superfamily pyrophosphatase or phosphodiesterase
MVGARYSVAACVVAAAIHLASGQDAAGQTRPDLVVAIAVDQFSASVFNQWRSRYKAGLKRFVEESILYSDAYQSHGLTETCAGHSTMLTGKHPNHTGIVGNEWYDAKTGKQVYCVSAPEYTAAHSPSARRVGPTLLIASTLGDWMKEQQPGSRVFAISGKDRSSITMAGHRADGVFWLEDAVGFTTSVAAGEDGAAKVAPLAKLNEAFKAEWASPPDWTYFEESCRSLESEYQIGNVTWRSKLPPEIPAVEGRPPQKIRPVHLYDRYTLEGAKAVIEHYQLGRRGVTDLLAVSFSATDFVGHGYGTQGPEMCDHVHRLDAQIGDLLKYLEAEGRRAIAVLTADHGGSDFVERLTLQGYANARRINPQTFLASVNAEIKQKLSLTADPLMTPDFTQFYAVNDKGISLDEPLRTQVIEAGVAVLNGRPEVEVAFSLKELLAHKITAGAVSDYSLRDRYSQSVMEGRSGDIMVGYKSGVTTGRSDPTQFLAGHKGPFRHDTAVPIVFWWPGAKGQTRVLPIDTTMIAPTLANIIGVKTPADLDGTCLDLGYPGMPKCPH